ncbi:MAG: type VI secretion system tip protein VgrG [Polyangiaceae bacterium]|nr:type VI secretion system tip protein VgrG [Polyangiaceae bacterium]
MALDQLVTLTIDGIDTPLRVSSLSVREAVCHAPIIRLICARHDPEGEGAHFSLADVISKTATVAWAAGDEQRSVEGVVDEIEAVGIGYKLTIVPRLAMLEDTCDYRVFLDQDAVEIATAVLKDHTISVDNRVSRTPEKRKQCVQSFESDLAFVRRILAEEGVSFYLPWSETDKVVFTDGASGFDDVKSAALPLRDRGGLDKDGSVFDARVETRTTHGKVVLNDYDFEKPMLDLKVEAKDKVEKFVQYEYPGRYKTPDQGSTLAQIRLEELRSLTTVLRASTSSRALSAGHVLEIEGGDDPAVGRWLLLEVEQEASDQTARATERFQARFVAVPINGSYRPKRSPIPAQGGVQTATVTGASGSEIHTEQHSRLKVHLRWDRERPFDDTSSMWTRPVHPPTSGGFFLPRVGWEVLTSFHSASADDPLVVGRLYNGTAVPPNGLPGDKVVTAFGSCTTPGGGSANVVSMNDTKGNEMMSFVASKDFNERTENDKVTAVTANDTWTVGATRKLIVGQVHEVGVKGSQSYSIGGSRTVNVTANQTIKAASETVMVGAARIFNIGGDYSTTCATLTRLVGAAKIETGIEHVKRQVLGASTVMVGGSCKMIAGANYGVNVMGAHTETVAGAKKIKASKFGQSVKGALNETLASRKIDAGGDRVEDFTASAGYTIGGSATLKGSDVVVVATGKITVKAGGVTLTIEPGTVTVDGKFKGSVKAEDSGDENYE